jgi:lactoylglutathione lyase
LDQVGIADPSGATPPEETEPGPGYHPHRSRIHRVLTVSHVTHVALRVKDIERSLDFYVGKLGFDEMFRLDRDGQLWLLYLRITDDQYFELFPEGEGDRAAPATAVGYNHMCLAVPDIDRTVKELEAAGVPLYRPKTLGADGNWQTWIEDPDGHRIELMQMMPDSRQASALADREAV